MASCSIAAVTRVTSYGAETWLGLGLGLGYGAQTWLGLGLGYGAQRSKHSSVVLTTLHSSKQ